MNLSIKRGGQILKNVRQISALGANGRSRRRLVLDMIRANLKRTHHGWSNLANRLLGTAPAGVQLRILRATPFFYRPGTTDLLVLEQVFLDREYDFASMARENIEYIVDLGSNIGTTALLWAQQYPGARMVLLEPDPENFALLRQNTAAFCDRCVLLPVAVSDHCGQTSFFRSEREYCHSVLKPDDCVSEIRVPTLTLPAILREAGFPRVDLLKMDIEGGERLVMPTIATWGAQTRYLIAELHPPYELDDFAADCRLGGLTAAPLEPERSRRNLAFAVGEIPAASRPTTEMAECSNP